MGFAGVLITSLRDVNRKKKKERKKNIMRRTCKVKIINLKLLHTIIISIKPDNLIRRFLSLLLVAGCDIGVRFSVHPSVCQHLCYQLQFYNSHHTLHITSPWPPDLAGTLTRWPWPIFRAPVTLTQFTLTFQIFSTKRPTTTKPCIVLILDVLTQQVHWPGDLDIYFALQ